jgi:hypothetical protein
MAVVVVVSIFLHARAPGGRRRSLLLPSSGKRGVAAQNTPTDRQSHAAVEGNPASSSYPTFSRHRRPLVTLIQARAMVVTSTVC